MTDFMTATTHDLKLLIAPFYVLIGLAILWAGWKSENRAQKVAVFSMTAIFLLCDLASYIGPALGLPHVVIFGAHVLLPVACLVFLMTNQHARLFSTD